MNTLVSSINNTTFQKHGEFYIFQNSLGKIGLDELNDLFRFFQTCLENNEIEDGSTVVYDFSNIIFWDISALLWLIIAVDYYKKLGNTSNLQEIQYGVKIKLPQPSINDELFKTLPSESISASDWQLLKSVDFLRRWKVTEALKNLSDNPNSDPLSILFDDQKEYYLKKPFEFYKATTFDTSKSNWAQEILSLNLVEIRNLVDFEKDDRKIERTKIDKNIDFFVKRAVTPVLVNHCKIPNKIAKKFITHLLAEGIENALQHPNASIGMFSIAKKKNKNKLILSIVDNGDPIPKTIYPHYFLTNREKKEFSMLEKEYKPESYSVKLLGDIILHATKDGVSRKGLDMVSDLDRSQAIDYLKTLPKRGEGLTHIRDCTTNDYNGVLNIETQGLHVRCSSDSSQNAKGVSYINRNFHWPGNLIEIELSIKGDKNINN